MRVPRHITREIRTCDPADLPTITDEETGETRDPTRSELLQMGIQVLGEKDAQLIVQCVGTAGTDWPGELVTQGRPTDRYDKLPDEIRTACLRARVYRARDGGNLRERLNERLGCHVHAGEACDGRYEHPPDNPDDAEQVLTEAKRCCVDDDPEAECLTCPMNEVQDGDVVERTAIWPARLCGELA